MEVPQKTKNRTTSNSISEYMSGKDENTNLRRYMHPNIHSSTIYNSQHMEANQVSINRQTDKEEVKYIYNGILLSHKKE